MGLRDRLTAAQLRGEQTLALIKDEGLVYVVAEAATLYTCIAIIQTLRGIEAGWEAVDRFDRSLAHRDAEDALGRTLH